MFLFWTLMSCIVGVVKLFTLTIKVARNDDLQLLLTFYLTNISSYFSIKLTISESDQHTAVRSLFFHAAATILLVFRVLGFPDIQMLDTVQK